MNDCLSDKKQETDKSLRNVRGEKHGPQIFQFDSMTAIDNLLSTCTSYRFLQQNADSCFCPNCKPFPLHLFGRAGHSSL